jgi:RecA-family ATPase
VPIENIFQLRDWQPPYRPDAIIEEGILLPQTATIIFGAAKSWKTMHSTHLAFCIASGLPWFGYKTTPANTFVHQVELPKLIDRDRIIKYANGRELWPNNIMFKTPTDQVLLDTTWGMNALAKDIEEVKARMPEPNRPLVVILDPLYLHMSGSISDSDDAKKFILNCNTLRNKYGITLIIVHHSRLTKVDNSGTVVDLGPEEAMGSSYWNNWVDTMIRFKVTNPYQGADKTEVSFALTRNAQNFLPRFTVQWYRHNLMPVVIERDDTNYDEPTVHNLVGSEQEL